MADADPEEELVPLECRDPTLEDLVRLSRELNERGAQYLIVGGFAIIQAGLDRHTSDIDLLVETSLENERRVLSALSTLPDNAVREIEPGEIARNIVIRVADEFTVDLMQSGCGIPYADAAKDAVIREIDGVTIPFASLATLWRMKQTYREKDIPDRRFLRARMEAEGIPLNPPPADARPPEPYADVPKWILRILRCLERWFPRR